MMGDEDEGFDEEFCDAEDPPLRSVPDLPPLNLQDLNNADLQTLLADNSLAADSTIPPFPTSSLLDDIDPGVYMLEAEHSTNSLLDRKSPLHSPFPMSTHSPSPSPVCFTMNSMSLADGGTVDEWNSYHHTFDNPYYNNSIGGSEYGSSMGACTPTQYLLPPPSPSLSCTPPPCTDRPYDLDMLVPVHQQPSEHHTFPTSPSHIQPHTPPYQHQPTCNLTLPVNFGSGCSSSSLPPATPPSAEPFQHPLMSSPTYPTNYEYNPLLSGHTKQPKGCTGGMGSGSSPHGTATDSTSGYSSCSTQTPLASSPSPAPISPAPPSTTSLSDSTDESDIPKHKPSSTGNNIVQMPFYKFKKILDSPSVPEEKKNNIKNIRRRGKNKIAAKTCRQRKMEVVLGLQQEIEQLRGMKSQICGRTNSLQREIEVLKAKCSALYRHRRQRNC